MKGGVRGQAARLWRCHWHAIGWVSSSDQLRPVTAGQWVTDQFLFCPLHSYPIWSCNLVVWPMLLYHSRAQRWIIVQTDSHSTPLTCSYNDLKHFLSQLPVFYPYIQLQSASQKPYQSACKLVPTKWEILCNTKVFVTVIFFSIKAKVVQYPSQPACCSIHQPIFQNCILKLNMRSKHINPISISRPFPHWIRWCHLLSQRNPMGNRIFMDVHSLAYQFQWLLKL